MGSRACGSAAATRAAARMYQPGTNTGGITHARPGNTHQPDGSRAGHPPLTLGRAADGAATVSRQWLPPVHNDPELADLRSQGHRGSVMGDRAEGGKRCCT